MKSAPPISARHWLGLLLALGCAVAGLGLAWHYPLLPALPGALLWLALAGAATYGWRYAALLLPAALPLIGFAPWSGWISFEEMDMAVLAVAAGGYLGWALQSARLRAERVPVWQRPLRWSGLVKLLLLGFAASLLIAVWRGIEDAGGWSFGWYQGYHEAMNSLRLGKSFFLALLLLPLWRSASALQPELLQRGFSLAMALALAACAGMALQERLAFTGLLNFSADYRTTGPFWEMHVGGAALDGALALCFPFAFALLLRERRPWAFAALLGLNFLGAYIAVTMFSRGVYLALPLGLGLTALLLMRGSAAAGPAQAGGEALPTWRERLPLLGVPLVYGLVAFWVFGGGGWRTLLALVGSALLLMVLPAPRLRWAQSPAQRLIVLLLAGVSAAFATALSAVLANWLPKGAYLIDAAVLAAGLALAWHWRRGLTRQLHLCAMAALWLWSLGCAGVVAGYWGGLSAAETAGPPLLLLALAWLLAQLLPLPAAGRLNLTPWRDRLLLWALAVLLIGLAGALGGGRYISERASTAERDLQGRLAHWQLTLDLLRDPTDWLLGRGTGRFPASYYFGGEQAQQVGDYRLRDADGASPHLTLTGGKHMLGWGELFRVTQRVRAPEGPLRVELSLRAERDLSLNLDLCEKHLLYSETCVTKEVEFKAKPGEWQKARIDLGRAPAMGGDWWAPRWIGFSVALASRGATVDLDDIRLSDARGELLVNSGFEQGMAHWFFSSDRHHMPWHAKSLAVHLLFEQGLLGLGLGALMLLAALWRCTLGAARGHALAPALAGALLAFVVVGLFDSLIDAPRVALLFWCVMLMALGLRAPTRAPAPARARRSST